MFDDFIEGLTFAGDVADVFGSKYFTVNKNNLFVN